MKRLIRWFCGYIDVRLYGHQVNRFINLCSRNGIHLWDIKRDLEHYFRVLLRLRDFYALKPFLRKTRTRIRIIGRHGFPFWCHRHPHLKWVPVFALIVLCVYIYSRTLIWEIQIQGNDLITDYELLQVLEEQSVAIGCKSSSLDCSSLEYEIRKRFTEIGWVSVYYEHTRLCVDVRESLYGEQEDFPPDTNRYDLIANKDAYVFSIVTRAGTPVITADTYVKKGDLLVKGFFYAYDDSGAIKTTKKVRAQAQILGDVVYDFCVPITEIEIMSIKISGADFEVSLRRLGQEKLRYYLELLENNGAVILDTKVIIEKNEKSVVYRGKIYAREEIGTNILVEELGQE
jgi:similar to stage IV sporulation protein